MRIANIIALMTAMATLTSAAPSQEISVKREMVDRCWGVIYQNQSSGGSPLVSDCLQIAANIARDGEWVRGSIRLTSGVKSKQTVSFCLPQTTTLIGQRQLVQYGTCAFGVEIDNRNKGPGFNFRVGNEDIITIINESIRQFQWFDKVGAMGFMDCVGNLDIDMFVKWGLYHT